MRIIVFSDSHGRVGPIEKIYKCHTGADYYIHLGDGYTDMCAMRSRYPEIKLLSVKGNTDFTSSDNDSAILELLNTRIFYTHGHLFSAKAGLEKLQIYAKSVGAKIVLFGHTHKQFYDFKDGVHYLNPGNAAEQGYCQFAIIDITETSIACTLSKIDSRF